MNTSEQFISTRISFTDIPDELKRLKQWVVYGKRNERNVDAVDEDGKLNKIPYCPHTKKQAKSNDPSTWSTFKEAVKVYDTGYFNGIGLAFDKKDNLVGIDLDHCLNSNLVPNDEAQAILDKFPNTYIEVSPSGDGLHIYCFGIAIHCGKGTRNKWIEIYGREVSGRFSHRYFCVTGNRFSETSEISNYQSSLAWLHENFKKEIIENKDVTSLQPVTSSVTQSVTPTVTSSSNHLEKYVVTAFDSEIGILKLAGDGDRNDTLFKCACRLKELCNSSWSAPYISEAEVVTRLLQVVSSFGLPIFTEKEARKTIASAFKTAGTRDEPKPVVAKAVAGAKQWAKDSVDGVNDEVIPKQPKLVYYDENGKLRLLKQSEASKALLSEIQQLRFDSISEEWMLWQDNYWQRCNNAEAMKFINNTIYENAKGSGGYTVNYVTGISQFLKWELATKDWNTKKEIVPLKNGVLNLNTMELTPHTPAQYMTWQLPYEYDPSATCDPIIDWLFETVTEPDQVELLRAYLNCIVLGRVEVQRFLELIGPGGTGKSSFIRLAEALVGGMNTHATELKRLEGEASRFEVARIYGKRLIIITDSDRFSSNGTMFKAIVGGDSLPYEEKNKQGSRPNFRSQAMVLVAANEPIQSGDLSSGKPRRRITIHFNNVVAPTKRRDLEREFEPYLPGLLNWVLALSPKRVEELIVDTVIHVPSLKIVTKDNLIATNPLAAWLDACVVLDEEAQTNVGQAFKEKEGGYRHSGTWLYPNYCEFCEGSGIKPISMRRFSDLLIDLCKNQLGQKQVKKMPKSEKGVKIQGLRIRSDFDDDKTSVVESSFQIAN